MNIIFLCHGNICRSAMARYIMTDILRKEGAVGDFEITSAAVSYEEEGNPMYPPAIRTLDAHGIPHSPHRAHRIQAGEFRRADLVIVMDRSNLRILRRILPGEDMGKVHFLMEYADGGIRDVADPWYSGDFETCYRDLFEGCRGLARHLRGE